MKVLFVYVGLKNGGIETFFVRIAKKLMQENVSVRFLFLTKEVDETLVQELAKYAEIIYLDNHMKFQSILSKVSPLFKLLIPFNFKFIGELLNGITHIHAPDFNSILFANKILLNVKKIPISTGIYHINEFNFVKFRGWYFERKIRKFFRNLSPKNILFFNEICKDFYNELYDNQFNESIVTPIGIELENDSEIGGLQNNKIVAVGRLTSWKKYNFHMIHVMKNLKDRGFKLYFHSYGDGHEKENLENLVKKFGLENQVKFFPGIPYKDFKKTVCGNLMFVGAGTALIEASSYGVPSLIGIENGETLETFGFLHETSGYSYQEIQLDLPKSTIESRIENLIALSHNDYIEECKKAKLRSKDFSIEKTCKDFKSLIQNAERESYYFSDLEIKSIVGSLLLNKLTNRTDNYSKRL